MEHTDSGETGRPGEFDGFAAHYEEALRDPVRDLFAPSGLSFFHLRKRDLILEQFRRRGVDPATQSYLDLGCGKGELLGLLGPAFGSCAGCDTSAGMLEAVQGVRTRVQADPLSIPFDNAQFDFLTAVCVYHHVPPSDRLALTREVRRVLRPGGTFCLIEHNPLNPVTRGIVRRTPVDANAVLLTLGEGCRLVGEAGLEPEERSYFLYLPESLYRRFGRLERWFSAVPLGGQWALFARRAW